MVASRFLTLTMALVCAGCATSPSPSSAAAEAPQIPSTPNQVQNQSANGCQPFTAPVIVGGKREQAVGEVCRQSDGSWRIVQNTPGLPRLVYIVPPEEAYPYPYSYPYPYPYYSEGPWSGGPSFFVGGSILFADQFHRFHHGPFFHDHFHAAFHDHSFAHQSFTHQSFAHQSFAHANAHGGGSGEGFHGGFHGGMHR
jgi:hypothetical protein